MRREGENCDGASSGWPGLVFAFLVSGLAWPSFVVPGLWLAFPVARPLLSWPGSCWVAIHGVALVSCWRGP